MKNSWLSGLNKKDQAEMKALFIQSRRLRYKLDLICEHKIKTSYKEARSKDRYDKPNWDLYQADLIGYVRALHEIKSLIENLKD